MQSSEYIFHDLYLWRETADLWTYSARFEGVMITASAAPNPDPADIIDQLLHSAKAVREHPSRNIELGQVEQMLGRYRRIASNLPDLS